MKEKLEPFMVHGDLEFAVDRLNRLCVNGEPVVTGLSLDWWVSVAIVVAGASTLALAVVEIGRANGVWM